MSTASFPNFSDHFRINVMGEERCNITVSEPVYGAVDFSTLTSRLNEVSGGQTKTRGQQIAEELCGTVWTDESVVAAAIDKAIAEEREACAVDCEQFSDGTMLSRSQFSRLIRSRNNP